MEQEQGYYLERFVEAQEHSYKFAKAELIEGHKRSHWMWYIFPQIKGLGYSQRSKYYALVSLEEARAYLVHPILGARLRELAQILLGLEECKAERIFGGIDACKLHSSLTLFDIVEPNGDFDKLLGKFFDSRRDQKTMKILQGL